MNSQQLLQQIDNKQELQTLMLKRVESFIGKIDELPNKKLKEELKKEVIEIKEISLKIVS